MFTQQQVKDIIEQVIGYSKLPGCQVDMQWTEDDFIRFARNGITTSGYRVTQQISITSTTADKRSGNSAVSELTPQALKAGVKQAEDLALISQPNNMITARTYIQTNNANPAPTLPYSTL